MMTNRFRGTNEDDRGAVLILALIYVVAVSLVVIALASWASNNLRTTANFTSVTQMEASARNTAEVAINSIRYTPLLRSDQTLNASTASYCWGTSAPSSETYNFASGGSSNTQTYTFSAWCSTTWNPLSSVSRTVNIYVCPSTIGVLSCEASPFLQVVVQFDDYPPGTTSSPIPSICSVWCGQGMTIVTWNWHPSNGAQSANTITLTSTAPTDAAVGGLYAPVVSSNSGSTVQVTSTTTSSCTVTSNVVLFVGVGDCTLVFSDPGTIAFLPAANVTQSFTVAPPANTPLSVDTVLSTYGTSLKLTASCITSCLTTNPLTFAFTALGANSHCTLNGTTLTSTTAGTCEVYAFKFGDGTNPALQSADTTVSFTPAVLTVTPTAGTSVFGSTPVAITPVYGPFVAGDTASSLTTQPTCSAPVTAQSLASSYLATCTGGVSSNYTFNYVSGLYKVTAQTLFVVPTAISVTYGSPSPTYSALYHTGSATGPVVTPTFAGSAPVCTSPYVPTSVVGVALTISCSGGVDTNYTFDTKTTALVTVTAAVPAPPAVVTASSGLNGQSIVSWSAPASNGGATITKYTVTSSPGALTCTTTTTTCTVSGLTNGTNYTFTVTASNSAGTGAASAASSTATPIGAPGAPTGVLATSGLNGSSVVSWTTPTSNGGADITTYSVTSAPGGFSCSKSSSPCIVSGLTNGTSYTFTVAATNSVGTGPNSAPSSSITPIGPPGPPTNVSASSGQNGAAAVSWSAPSTNGGAPITSYSVTSTPGSLTCTTAATSCSVGSLANGTAYTFTVTATNSAGVGAASSPSASVTPSAAPTGVAAKAGAGSAVISWSAPASNGGAVISSYSVTSVPVVTPPVGCTAVTGLTCAFTGLTAGTSYTFSVKVTNLSGTGAASSASNAVTPFAAPGAPGGLKKSITSSTSFTLSWTAPATNGATISGYDVEWRAYPAGAFAVVGSSGVGSGTCGSTTAATTSCTVSGLPVGSLYQFEVAATSNAGTGSYATITGGYPALVNASGTGVSSNANKTYTFTISTVTQGNSLILQLGSLSNTGISSASYAGTGAGCTTSANLTKAVASTNTPANKSDTEIWYAQNLPASCSNETVTVNFAANPTLAYGLVQQWTGLSSTTPVLDGTAATSGTTPFSSFGANTPMTTGSLTPAPGTSYDLVVGLVTATNALSTGTPTVTLSGTSSAIPVSQSVDTAAPFNGIGAYVVDPGKTASGFSFASGASQDSYSAVAVAFLAN